MLRVFRIFSIIVYVALSMTIGIFYCLVRPFHPNNVYVICKLLAWKGFDILGIKFITRDSKYLATNKSAVYVSNHQNNYDMFPGGASLPPRTVVIGKKSIKWIPIFGQFFVLSGNILINRKDKDSAKESMNEVTRKIVEENISIWVMPEGTRSWGKGLLPFKQGAFLTAIRAQVPVIATVFSSYSSDLVLNRIKSGVIIAQTLAPIPTIGLTDDDVQDLMKRVHSMMLKTLNSLDSELRTSKI